jgi:hypothetical protein
MIYEDILIAPQVQFRLSLTQNFSIKTFRTVSISVTHYPKRRIIYSTSTRLNKKIWLHLVIVETSNADKTNLLKTAY